MLPYPRPRLDCYHAPAEQGHEQEVRMPIVRIEMWPGRTKAQKREMARAITDVVCNVAHTTPDQTIVVFQDVSKDDWAQSGKLASEDDD